MPLIPKKEVTHFFHWFAHWPLNAFSLCKARLLGFHLLLEREKLDKRKMKMTLKVDFSWCLVPLVKAWFFRIPLSFPCLLLSLCFLDFLVGAFKPWREFFGWGSLNWALRVYKVQFCQDSASFVGFFCFLDSAEWNLVGDFRVFIWYNSRIRAWDLKEFCVSLELIESGFCWLDWAKKRVCFSASESQLYRVLIFVTSGGVDLFYACLAVNYSGLFWAWMLSFWVWFWSFEWFFFSLCGYIEKLSIWFAETVGDWGWSTRKIVSVCASL